MTHIDSRVGMLAETLPPSIPAQASARVSPIDNGYDAYGDGVEVSDNPYDENTKERRAWEDGGRAAHKHDYDESEG